MTEPVHLRNVAYDPASVVTVGTFDGVHAGHQALLEYVRGRAEARGARSVAVTFDPHPREVVRDEPVQLLSTVDERAHVIDALGIDQLVVVEFTRAFAQMGAAEFVRSVLVKTIGMQEIVIGYDFNFGRGREGDGELLERLGDEEGKEQIAGIGAGLRWDPAPWLYAELYYGYALNELREENDDLQDRGIYFRVTVEPL